MKYKFLIATALLAVLSTSAQADTSLYGGVSLSSDYVVRGASLNDNELSLGAMVGVQRDSLYADVSINNTTVAGSDAEILARVGFTGGDTFTYDVGVSHRYYHEAVDDIDQTEVNASVGMDIGIFALNGGVDYNIDNNNVYYSVGTSIKTLYGISLNAKIGLNDLDTGFITDGGDVSDYSVGISKQYKNGLVASLDFYEADADVDVLNIYDKKWVASVGFPF